MHFRVQLLPTVLSSSGLPGAAWQLLVGHQCPGPQLQETQYWFCIFCIISLITNIISIVNVIFKNFYIHSLPFPPFFLPLVGGRGLIESI